MERPYFLQLHLTEISTCGNSAPFRKIINYLTLLSKWSGWTDLNRRHLAPKASGLNQTDLHPV